MTMPMMPEDRNPRERPGVAAGPLWAGGVATAVVAALVALVGILICRWLLKVPILAPGRDGAWGNAHTVGYAFGAAAAALVATAIMHLLMLSVPRPLTFFGWILGLATLVAVLFPFSTTAEWSQKFATAIVNLVIGFAIGSLIGGVAAGRATSAVVLSNTLEDPYPRHPPSRTPGDGRDAGI
jgi:hypothetical protein